MADRGVSGWDEHRDVTTGAAIKKFRPCRNQRIYIEEDNMYIILVISECYKIFRIEATSFTEDGF